MKKTLIAVAMMCASTVSAITISTPAKAGMGDNYIGPSVNFGGSETAVGIDSKFGVSENLSLRPFVIFPNSRTLFGASLTYDFDLPQTSRVKVTPFLGGGAIVSSGNNNNNDTRAFFTGGVDLGVTENVALKAGLQIPFGGNGSNNTIVNLAAGFRF